MTFAKYLAKLLYTSTLLNKLKLIYSESVHYADSEYTV